MNHQTEIERVYAVLADGNWHSTKELIERTGINRISARIYDLRHGNTTQKAWYIEARNTKIDGVRWREYRIRSESIHSPVFLELQKLLKVKVEATHPNIAEEDQPTLFAYDKLHSQT